MKKLFFLLLSATLLFACNQSSNKVEADEPAVEVDSHAGDDAAQTTKLALNNGAKWKADSNTTRNAIELQAITTNFKTKQNPSINDYQALSGDFSNGLNKMVKECKMKGPDHDALHLWLQPVLKGNKELKAATDSSVAETTFKSINTQLDAYYTYFELP